MQKDDQLASLLIKCKYKVDQLCNIPKSTSFKLVNCASLSNVLKYIWAIIKDKWTANYATFKNESTLQDQTGGQHMITHLHIEYLSSADIQMAGLLQFFCLPVKVSLSGRAGFPWIAEERRWGTPGPPFRVCPLS